jgi:type IV pilus assembly protein PilE
MSGFTLVELMVVILVIAILASIAVPTYQSQIRKSRRTDAKAAVLDLASREEKYFSLNNTYTNSSANLGYAGANATISQQPVGNGYYQMNVCLGTATNSTSTTTFCAAAGATATGSSYVIAAVPVTGSSQLKDTSCQYFAVDNTGTQYASNSAGGGADDTATCWQ